METEEVSKSAESTEVVQKIPGMIEVPGGDYIRGRSYFWPDSHFKWYPNSAKDDTPIGPVVISTFYIDETEVTNEQYAAFVESTGRKPPFHWIDGKIAEGRERHPVVNVSWDDAVAYCTSLDKRLPTEAEWEKACRGGVERKMYPWGDDPPNEELAFYGSLDGAAPVCSVKKSPNGLCDISGNVWEWVHDWYYTKYYEEYSSPEETENPTGPPEGMYRSLRGGGWMQGQDDRYMTCSYRSWALPTEMSPTIGFRCVQPE